MKDLGEIMGAIFSIMILITGLALIMALPTMWLWNWLVPTLFHGPEVTFLQALGLNFLCSILFKNSATSSKK